MYVLSHRGVVLQLHEGLSPVLLHNSQIRCHTLLRHQPANLPVFRSLLNLQGSKHYLQVGTRITDPESQGPGRFAGSHLMPLDPLHYIEP
jgi:hypothetical protein